VSAKVSARGLEARYGKAPALRGLDAEVAAGEVVAVLGENGSGKSTLLKVLARVLPSSGGEIRFDGRPLDSIPRRETARAVAYVPQSVDLVFPIRSLDLVLQGRAPHGRGFVAETPEDRRRALEAMRACDVEGLAERDAASLSEASGGGSSWPALSRRRPRSGSSTSPRPGSIRATASNTSRRCGGCTASGTPR